MAEKEKTKPEVTTTTKERLGDVLRRVFKIIVLTNFIIRSPFLSDKELSFKYIFRKMKSGRENLVEVAKTITKHVEPELQKKYMNDFLLYNAQLDSSIYRFPIGAFSDFLDSSGARFDYFRARDLDYRILVHDNSLAGTADHSYKRIQLDPISFQEEVGSNTLAHELFHTISFANGKNNGSPKSLDWVESIHTEGSADFGALLFRVFLNRQLKKSDDEIRKLVHHEDFYYTEELVTSALCAGYIGVDEYMRHYLNGDFGWLQSRIHSLIENQELEKSFYQDEKNFNEIDVLRLIRCLVQKYGQGKFDKVYTELCKKYFLDSATRRMGRLVSRGQLLYFDNVQLEKVKRPYRFDGEYTVLLPTGVVMHVVYDEKFGLRDYQQIKAQARKRVNMFTMEGRVPLSQVFVHPVIDLSKSDFFEYIATIKHEITPPLSQEKK